MKTVKFSVTFKRAGSHGNNVTLTVCVQSYLMYLMLITTVTFVCVIEARGQLSFYLNNIRDVFQIEGMLKVFKFGCIGAAFGANQRIRLF